jgi:Tfp pilus assembly protein PilX
MHRTVHRPRRHGERGIALVVAIGCLLVLSILGAVVMTVANRGLEETRSFSPMRRSFYAVDQAVEYSMNGDLIYNLSMSGTISLVNPASTATTADDALDYLARDRNGASLGVSHEQVIEKTSGSNLLSGQVTDLGPQGLPASLAGRYTSDFGANLYHVTAEAVAPAGDAQRVDASIVRLYKLEDDVIFRTTGGG